MKTKIKSKTTVRKQFIVYRNTIMSFLLLFSFMFIFQQQSFAHCDSYDGPVVKDALKALKKNNVNLVLKWIDASQEQEIIRLFDKTYKLKTGDKEIYEIVEKHFLETLVRLHRETEGAPFTGLKPAGSIKNIILLSDKAISEGNVDDLLIKLNKHTENVIKEKYKKLVELDKVKDESTEKGREYVKAYIDYTHTIEGIHDIIDGSFSHSEHNH